MCITRVAKVMSVLRGRAEVEFLDGRGAGEVDVSVLGDVSKGAFVEVYGNLALSTLSAAEARRRKAAWDEVRRAAMLPESDARVRR